MQLKEQSLGLKHTDLTFYLFEKKSTLLSK